MQCARKECLRWEDERYVMRLKTMLNQDKPELVAGESSLLTSFSSCSRGHSGSDRSFPPP